MSARPRRLGVTAALVNGVRVHGDVTVHNGCIDAVGLPAGPGGRGLAVPGIVDWQVNGFGGVHFTGSDVAGFVRSGEALAAAGVVWAAPTILNTSLQGYLDALGVLAEYTRAHPGGGLLGAHLEGPNLSEEFPGAHDPRNFIDGHPSLVGRFLAAGPVAMVTLAPERRGVMEMVEQWVAAGVKVSIGHSDADSSVCARARSKGASAVTHCWNAHRRFAARDPGPAAWALTDRGVSVGLIADGIHVAPEVLALTFTAAPRRVALSTDAIALAGPEPPEPGVPSEPSSGVVATQVSVPPVAGSSGDEARITVRDAAARLADGTLAGSVATPTRMLRVLEGAGVPFEHIVHALSVPQAEALGLPANMLRPGDPGDVTVLGGDHEVLQTWRRGDRVF